MSEASKRKVSESKKGTPAWNKGIPTTLEAKQKMSVARKGVKIWPNGRIFTVEWRKKMSLAKLGKPSGRKGIKLSPEWCKHIGDSKRGIPKSNEHNLKNRDGQTRRYLKINPHYVVATRNKRIAINGGFHSENEWMALKAKYNFTCANPACKKREPEIKLTRDHILPILLGGKNDIKNIQPLCNQCNRKKHTKTIRY